MIYKKTMVLCSLFMVHCLGAGCIDINLKKDKKAEWKRLFMRYVPTVIIGGVIGTGTGGIAGYIVAKCNQDNRHHQIILHLVASFFENMVRNAVVKEIQHDLDDCSIEHKKELMRNIARLCSWGSYFMVDPVKVDQWLDKMKNYRFW